MPPPFNPEIRESFDERIEILFRELELALKWDRPSILLAIYSSHYVRADAERALAARLRELNQTTTEYLVNEANADILINLSEHPHKATTVFYIAGLQNGGGADGRNAYRALNLRREYFVDYRIRAVVWLTEKEASVLPRYAPDFWAFRHRVVEFMDRPEPHAAKIASEVAWSGLDDRTAREDTDAKIELRLALLKDLPEGDETLAARADLQYTLAGLYAAKREFEETINYFQSAREMAERLQNARLQAMCYNGLGNVYHDLQRYDDALAAYQRAIALDPNNAFPHNGLGNLLAQDATRVREAEAEYRAAIELDPKLAQAHNNLGLLLARDATRVREAEAEFRAAMALDPKDADAHNNLGALLAKDATRVREAEAEFRAAMALDPKYAKAHNNLGALLAEDATRVREAEAEYRAAMALDPKDAGAHYNLGLLLADDATRVRDAEAEYRAAIELDPENANRYISLALLFREQGRESEAIPLLEKRAQLDPGNLNPFLALASIHKKLGHAEESAKFAAQARALIKSDDWYNLACLESVCGNVDAAVAHLRRAAQSEKFNRDRVKRDPDFEWIREDARFKEIVGNE
jgi:tetratricopeptide (TPR) repeat protein